VWIYNNNRGRGGGQDGGGFSAKSKLRGICDMVSRITAIMLNLLCNNINALVL
jgi:hypothetical protein